MSIQRRLPTSLHIHTGITPIDIISKIEKPLNKTESRRTCQTFTPRGTSVINLDRALPREHPSRTTTPPPKTNSPQWHEYLKTRSLFTETTLWLERSLKNKTLHPPPPLCPPSNPTHPGAHLLELSGGTEGRESRNSGSGLGAALELGVHDERQLRHLLHAVAARHDERWHGGGGESRGHGVALLVHVHVAVPEAEVKSGGGGGGRGGVERQQS